MRALVGTGTMVVLVGASVVALQEIGWPEGASQASPPGDTGASPARVAPPGSGSGAAAATGPSGDGRSPGTEASGALAVTAVSSCPDPKNCTSPNGTGVYTAEGGFAGITVSERLGGAVVRRDIMITHFINNDIPNDRHVTFRYGYFDVSTNKWVALPGSGIVKQARYHNKALNVISVTESATMPVWTLHDPAASVTSMVSVSDKELLDLKLKIEFEFAAAKKIVILEFNNAQTYSNRNVVRTYNMRWWLNGTSSGWTQYCFADRNAQTPDPIVFQHGIEVDPTNGAIHRRNPSSSVVTVSCYLGAPAQVYGWGYDYLDANTDFYFRAGIHMKRASYCGDESYYTQAGTEIWMHDDQPIRDELLLNGNTKIEAQWKPDGAVCVNPENVRHLSMVPIKPGLLSCTNPHLRDTCSFICKGIPVPRCPAPLQLPPPPFLVDRPKQLHAW